MKSSHKRRNTSPSSNPDQQRIEEILSALRSSPPNIIELRRIALSPKGLLSRGYRSSVWPILSGISLDNLPPFPFRLNKREREAAWMDQVKKDIDRSLWSWTSTNEERELCRKQLTLVISRVLSSNPQTIHYFQGFHDIAGVCLLVCGERLSATMLISLANTSLSPWFSENLTPILQMLGLLFPIVSSSDPHLAEFLINSGVPPLFAVSWVLTWFSHNVDELDAIQRLFDSFLALSSETQLLPVYASAAIILHCKQFILSLPCESSAIHGFFTRQLPTIVSKIPNDNNIQFQQQQRYIIADDLILQALDLLRNIPPQSLETLIDFPISKQTREDVEKRNNRNKRIIEAAQAVAVAIVASGITAGAFVITSLLQQ